MRKKHSRVLLDLEVRNERATSKGVKKTILAVDYGEKCTGLAYSPDGRTILPLEVLDTPKAEGKMLKTIDEKSIEIVVFGLPLGIHGEENHICEAIRSFAQKIDRQFSGKVDFVNERYSSQTSLPGTPSERVDDLAAMNILEYYLSHKS